MRVLVVEDDGAIRHLLSEVLQDRGHEVSAVGDAESAWRLIQRQPFQLMVLDWILPGMDGLELCRKVRTQRDGDASVILMITARGATSDLVAVLDAGADDYLAKPFDIAMLDVRLTVAERHVASIQARRRAEAALRDTWRMQGALLAARTVEHHLGNELALTMGYSELLSTEPDLPERYRPMADAALRGVQQAADTLSKLRRIIRLEEVPGGAGVPMLDLERSVTCRTARRGRQSGPV
jgi:DNA-binding response OmpR family regulator